MPDDVDYADLRWLLDHPAEWSGKDVENVRYMIETQKAAIAHAHTKDARRRAGYAALVAELEAALQAHHASRG
jgi:hypothetical protein